MRCVVFGICAARITVVVFNQVFKNRGKKSNFCAKIASKLKPANLEISAWQKSSRRFRPAAHPAFERAPHTTTPPYACTPRHKGNRSPVLNVQITIQLQPYPIVFRTAHLRPITPCGSFLDVANLALLKIQQVAFGDMGRK